MLWARVLLLTARSGHPNGRTSRQLLTLSGHIGHTDFPLAADVLLGAFNTLNVLADHIEQACCWPFADDINKRNRKADAAWRRAVDKALPNQPFSFQVEYMNPAIDAVTGHEEDLVNRPTSREYQMWHFAGMPARRPEVG